MCHTWLSKPIAAQLEGETDCAITQRACLAEKHEVQVTFRWCKPQMLPQATKSSSKQITNTAKKNLKAHIYIFIFLIYFLKNASTSHKAWCKTLYKQDQYFRSLFITVRVLSWYMDNQSLRNVYTDKKWEEKKQVAQRDETADKYLCKQQLNSSEPLHTVAAFAPYLLLSCIVLLIVFFFFMLCLQSSTVKVDGHDAYRFNLCCWKEKT